MWSVAVSVAIASGYRVDLTQERDRFAVNVLLGLMSNRVKP
jgi:hypothetical protein